MTLLPRSDPRTLPQHDLAEHHGEAHGSSEPWASPMLFQRGSGASGTRGQPQPVDEPQFGQL